MSLFVFEARVMRWRRLAISQPLPGRSRRACGAQLSVSQVMMQCAIYVYHTQTPLRLTGEAKFIFIAGVQFQKYLPLFSTLTPEQFHNSIDQRFQTTTELFSLHGRGGGFVSGFGFFCVS
ncbi:hypothetical protein AN191_16290 [Loktanella sp. 5RATIMAR09]|nr:hypothetical protein AN191_16290 [Loktanella sp. 5RATIMAR09]